MRQPYIDFNAEYLSLSRMTPVVTSSHTTNYTMLDSRSTALQSGSGGFDGFCPTSSGWSLNNLQMVGPNIQSNILDILIRFGQQICSFCRYL